MAKNEPTNTGQAYVATVTQACDINGYRLDGSKIKILSASVAGQYSFVAISNPTEITDDAAVIVPFRDAALAINGGEGGAIIIDQTYDAASANAQSGMAVAEALADCANLTQDNTFSGRVAVAELLVSDDTGDVTISSADGFARLRAQKQISLITSGSNSNIVVRYNGGINLSGMGNQLFINRAGITYNNMQMLTSSTLSTANTWSAAQTITLTDDNGSESVTFDIATLRKLNQLLATVS